MAELRSEPTTTLLSEMEGFADIWDEKKERFGIRLQRNTLPDYATDDFWEAVSMWKDWQTFGFPNSGGKDDQPALYIDVLRIMNRMAERVKAE